jgi:hypothetical protein
VRNSAEVCRLESGPPVGHASAMKPLPAPLAVLVLLFAGWVNRQHQQVIDCLVGCRNIVRPPERTRERHHREDHGAGQKSRHTPSLTRSAGVFVRVDELQCSVRPVAIVMIREDSEDPFEMRLIENQRPIQAL